MIYILIKGWKNSINIYPFFGESQKKLLEEKIYKDLIFDPIDGILDYGKPVYKQTKGLVPYGGVLEAFIGAGFQGLEDFSRQDLTKFQKGGRMGLVATEELIVDLASSSMGKGGAVAFGGVTVIDGVPFDEVPGAAFGYFFTMDGTSLILTYEFEKNNEELFPLLGLGEK